jgi:hypothetical protein
MTVAEAVVYVTATYYTTTEAALRNKIFRGDLGDSVIRKDGDVRIDRQKLDEILQRLYRGRPEASKE